MYAGRHRRCSLSAEESKKIVLGFIDDVSHGMSAAFADDVTRWLPGSLPVAGPYTGKKEVLEDCFGRAQSYFKPNSVSVQVQIAEDNAVAVEWIARGKTAKGETDENYCRVRFDVEGRKIQAVREYVDTLYAKDVLFSETPPWAERNLTGFRLSVRHFLLSMPGI